MQLLTTGQYTSKWMLFEKRVQMCRHRCAVMGTDYCHPTNMQKELTKGCALLSKPSEYVQLIGVRIPLETMFGREELLKATQQEDSFCREFVNSLIQEADPLTSQAKLRCEATCNVVGS